MFTASALKPWTARIPSITVVTSIEWPGEIDNDYDAALDPDVPELSLEVPALTVFMEMRHPLGDQAQCGCV